MCEGGKKDVLERMNERNGEKREREEREIRQ